MPYLPRLLRQRGRTRLALAAGLVVLALAVTGIAVAGGFSGSAHGNAGILPRGCGSCHVGHGGPDTTMLPSSEADTCFMCHGDAAARNAAVSKGLLTQTEGLLNVAAVFNKASHHQLGDKYEAGSNTVSCADCHHPHYSVKATDPSGRNYKQVKQIHYSRGSSQAEYKLCYRCHGTGAQTVRNRKDIERLTRPANPSYHPVEALGRNSDVPGLLAPYDEQSYVACTDCHANDQSSGPRGPHGSTFDPILKAHFRRDDGHNESSYEYALCYRCHSQSALLSKTSPFEDHKKHIDSAKTSCKTCHNSHGSTTYPHLIDFDQKTVSANEKGRLEYVSTSPGRGECSLRCHGEDHDRENYGGGHD